MKYIFIMWLLFHNIIINMFTLQKSESTLFRERSEYVSYHWGTTQHGASLCENTLLGSLSPRCLITSTKSELVLLTGKWFLPEPVPTGVLATVNRCFEIRVSNVETPYPTIPGGCVWAAGYPGGHVGTPKWPASTPVNFPDYWRWLSISSVCMVGHWDFKLSQISSNNSVSNQTVGLESNLIFFSRLNNTRHLFDSL